MADKYPKTNLKAGIKRAEVKDATQEENPLKTAPVGQKRKKEKPMIKTGRPELPAEEKLSKKVTLNFTETEYQKMMAESKKHYGVPLGKMLKQFLIDNNFFK